MNKIAIVCDSSASLTPKEIKEKNIYVAPLPLIYDGKEFLDQITITTEEVNQLLRENAVITTSQPNLGSLVDLFEEIKTKNYDHIFVLPISTQLSGTHSTFVSAIEYTGIKNATVIDTMSLVGPIQKGIDVVLDLNSKGKSVEEITQALNNLYDDTQSYVIPLTLKQLKASGRISPAAATMASLLKIKPVLRLENKGSSIDKFGTARTEAKAIDIVIQDLIRNKISPDLYQLYLLHSEGELTIDAIKKALNDKIGEFQIKIAALPAALATHAGLGTTAVQYVLIEV